MNLLRIVELSGRPCSNYLLRVWCPLSLIEGIVDLRSTLHHHARVVVVMLDWTWSEVLMIRSSQLWRNIQRLSCWRYLEHELVSSDCLAWWHVHHHGSWSSFLHQTVVFTIFWNMVHGVDSLLQTVGGELRQTWCKRLQF